MARFPEYDGSFCHRIRHTAENYLPFFLKNTIPGRPGENLHPGKIFHRKKMAVSPAERAGVPGLHESQGMHNQPAKKNIKFKRGPVAASREQLLPSEQVHRQVHT